MCEEDCWHKPSNQSLQYTNTIKDGNIDKDVNNRLAGTVCANTAAILNGADIIRVHDIKEGIDTVKIADYILKAHI